MNGKRWTASGLFQNVNVSVGVTDYRMHHLVVVVKFFFFFFFQRVVAAVLL